MPGTHDFQTVATKDIHVGRVLGFRIDEVVMPDGDTALREVVEHLGAVAVVALDERDNVTMIHQYRHPLGQRLWELPAGLLDKAGEDPEVTARRELSEEVGQVAVRWEVLLDMAASPGFTDQVTRIYLARDLSEVDRELQGAEEADLVVRKIPLAEAVEMALAGEIIEAAALTGILAVHAVVTGAARTRPVNAPWQNRPTRFAARRSVN